MQHIQHDGRQIAQGEEFEPMPGYRVVFVRDEGSRLILRDASGEFSRPIRSAVPAETRPPKLGDRRTLVEVVPDHRPLVDESIYAISHQVCVPGGWQNVKTCRVRSAAEQAGVYSDNTTIRDSRLRSAAETLWQSSTPIVANRALSKLSDLRLKVSTQEGEEGQPGSWDDPALAMEMAELLEKANIF